MIEDVIDHQTPHDMTIKTNVMDQKVTVNWTLILTVNSKEFSLLQSLSFSTIIYREFSFAECFAYCAAE